MIRREDVLPYFEELEEKSKTLPIEAFGMVGETKAHQMMAFQAWMAEAEAAIAGVFPPTHAIRARWPSRSRVAGKHCCFPAPSELDVKVALHPARVFTIAPAGRGCFGPFFLGVEPPAVL